MRFFFKVCPHIFIMIYICYQHGRPVCPHFWYWQWFRPKERGQGKGRRKKNLIVADMSVTFYPPSPRKAKTVFFCGHWQKLGFFYNFFICISIVSERSKHMIPITKCIFVRFRTSFSPLKRAHLFSCGQGVDPFNY